MKRTLSLLIVLLLVVSCIACKKDKSTATPTTTSQEPSVTAEPAELSTTTVETSTAEKYQEHITIALDTAITTIDPQIFNSRVCNIFFYLTHDRLIRYDSSSGTYQPELAESWEWVTPTELDLKLREGVKFHDGSPFTAEDVAFMLDRATNATVTDYYDHSEIVDDYNIKVFCKNPNVDFIATLAHNVTAMTSKAACTKNPETGAYIGTGTWIIKEVVSGDRIELVANEDYWGGAPKTKTMTVRFITEASARLIALQNREVDIILKVSNSEISYAQEDPNIVVAAYPSSELVYMSINTSKAPGNDLNMRLALAYAINRDEIISAIGDSAAAPATSFFNWSGYGYFDAFEKDISYNPEKAKEYVAKLADPTITINVSTAQNKLMAQVIQSQCKAVGLNVIINEMDASGLNASCKWETGDHESLITSISFNPHGGDIARVTSYGSDSNKSHVDDKRLQELLTLSVGTTDDDQRKAYYREIQELIHDNVYWIPLVYVSGNLAYVKDLGGIVIEPNNSHDLSYACIPLK